jgi:hypothetical protein
MQMILWCFNLTLALSSEAGEGTTHKASLSEKYNFKLSGFMRMWSRRKGRDGPKKLQQQNNKIIS